MKLSKTIGALACALYFLAAIGIRAQTAPANVSATRLIHADDDKNNWLTHGRTYREGRFSPLDQINPGNLDRLNLAWHADLDSERGQEATPIIVEQKLAA